MPREQGAGSGEASEGRENTGLNDWQRIDAEQAQRDAAGRKWDASHDPSPEFEKQAMPLGPDYGRDRPKHREYTPEQKEELEAAFGRPIEELLALRDKDPRAGHNRDEQGRILDSQGDPRELVDPREELLNEQTRRTATDAVTPATADDSPAEDEPTDHKAAERSDDLQAPSDERPEPEMSPGLGELAGQLATDLRSGKLTPQQAAEQLEAFRDDLPTATAEPSTATVRTEHTPDGDLYYQRGTPEGIEDQPGDRTANEESEEVSDRERRTNAWIEGSSNLLDGVRGMGRDWQEALPPRLPPGSHGETTVRQPDGPVMESRAQEQLDAGNVLAGLLATGVAVIVIRQKIEERFSRARQE